MEPLPPVLDDAVGGIAGEEVDDDVGIERSEPAGDREIALDVPEPDRAREPEHAPLTGARRARGGGRRLDGRNGSVRGGRDGGLGDVPAEGEVADEVIDLHRVAAEEPVASPIESDETGSGNGRHHLLRVRIRDDLVVRPVQGEGGDANLAEQIVQIDAVDGAQRLDQHLGGGLARPRHAVLDALERVGLREDPLEQAVPPVVEVVANHPGHPFLERLRHRFGVLAGEQDQVGEPVGMGDRVAESERRRARERHEDEGRPRHLVEHGEKVAVAGVHVVAGGRPVGSSVAARVHGDHAKVARQVGDLMLPHPAVRDDLTLGQQEEVTRPASRHLVEDAGVRPMNVHRELLASDVPVAPGHLVKDQSRAASDGGTLVGGHHAHPGRVERGGESPAPDPALDVVLERGE